jgi:predicted metal-dependent phosphoesterase TrpH
MKRYQNLHHHTTVSDGKLSYLQTLRVCQENNIEAVAFTDHDSLPSEKAVKALQKHRSGPVEWIIGLEISSGLPKELGGKPTSNFHILGLFIDPFNRRIKNYCQKMQAARMERMERMVKNLNRLGFKITTRACLAELKGETINRPHIVAALLKRPENIKLIQKLKDKMIQDAKQNPEVKNKLRQMIQRGPGQYPYSLFLGPDTYLKDVYVDYLYGLDLDQTAKIIRGAGGVAILAHWTFKRIDFALVEKLIKQKRIDGLEVVYNAHIPGREKQILADMKILKKLAEKYQALQSGGADSHVKEQIIDFFKDKTLAGKTIGLAQKMIKQGKIDTTWSSFD